MEGKKKKKEKVDESPGYEDLLDGFAFEQKADEPRTDLDGLALAELLGDEGGAATPDESENVPDSEGIEDYSDLARQFETLDLNALDTVTAEEPDIRIAEESPSELEAAEGISFDGSLKLGEDELADGSEYASLLDSIGAETKDSRAAEPEEFSLDDLHLEEMPESVEAVPVTEDTETFDFAGFSLDDFKSPNETAFAPEEEQPVSESVLPDDLKFEKTAEKAPDLEDLNLVEISESAAGLEDLKWNVMPEESADVAVDAAESEDMVDVAGGITTLVDVETEAGEELPEEAAGVSDAGYAAALSDMFGDGKSTVADDEPGIFDTGTRDDSSGEALFETDRAEEELSISSLLGGAAEEEAVTGKTAELKASEEPAPEPELDFLGLSSIGAAPAEKKEEKKKARAKTEALYEGVEMDFDEQIADVTLAELLLAQGKKKEATDLFVGLSKKKGVTSWVAKRLRALASAQDK